MSFNRPFQSQTDLFGTKILTPQFFLENTLALCSKVGGSENFPPSDPPGPPEPLSRCQTPQNRIIAYFARKNYLPFSRSCRTLINLHTIPKKMDPTFFGSIFDLKTPKKRQKRAKFEKGKKESPYGSIFDLTSISKPKILEFYHTLRKTWQNDV